MSFMLLGCIRRCEFIRTSLIIIEISVIHDIHAVIPAKAGIQQEKKPFV